MTFTHGGRCRKRSEWPLEDCGADVFVSNLGMPLPVNPRSLPGRTINTYVLHLMMGSHVISLQIFDQMDYPVSGVITFPFRKGTFLSDLEASPSIQAHYSIYPDALFERANVCIGNPQYRQAQLVSSVSHTFFSPLPFSLLLDSV